MDLMTLVAKVRMDSSDYESKIGTLPNMAAGAGKLIAGALKTWVGVKAVGALKDFAKSSIETGRVFDASMSQLAATMGTTASEIGELRDYAKEMGRTTVFTASQAADAMNILAMAGYKQEDIIKTLPATLSLAAAGNLDIAQAADYATGIMAGFGMEMDEAGRVGNVLAKIASSAKGDVASFGEGLASVAGTASVTGQNMEDMTVALGILGNHNISASEAGNALNRSLRNLYMASGDSAETLKSLGVEMYDMATGQARALPDVLRDLNSALDGMTDAQKNDILSHIFDAATLKSVPFLIDGVTTEWDNLDEAVKSSWFTKDSLTEQLDSVGLSLGGMRHAMRVLGVDGKTFNKLLGESQGNAEEFAKGLLEAAPAGTELSDVVDALGGDLSVLQGSFDSATGAAQAMADEQVNNLDGAMKLFDSAVESAQIAVSDLLAPSLTSLVHYATDAISGITDAFENGGIEGAVEYAGTLFESLGQQIVQDFHTQLNAAPEMYETGTQMINNVVNGIITGIPGFLEQASSMLSMFVDGLLQNLPLLLEAGGNMILNLLNGIVSNLPQIVTGAFQLVMDFVGGILTHLPEIIEAGFQLITNLAVGLIKAIPQLIAKIPEIIMGIVDTFASFDWLSIGKNIIDGIANGIKNFASSVFNAVKDVAKGAFDGVKNFFGIKSPSKLMRDKVGRYIPEGIAKGILDGIPSVTRAIDELDNLTYDRFDTARAIEMNLNKSNSDNSSSGNSVSSSSKQNSQGGYNEIISLLKEIAYKDTSVSLEGDASKIFKVVKDQDKKFKERTGASTFVYG